MHPHVRHKERVGVDRDARPRELSAGSSIWHPGFRSNRVEGAVMGHIRKGLALSVLLYPAGMASAQTVIDHTDLNSADAFSVRSLHGGGQQEIRRSFEAETEAISVFRDILAATGIPGVESRILIRASTETSNAFAGFMGKGPGRKRVIFYNATYVQQLKSKTGNYWAMVFVVAHEAAHHIMGHLEFEGENHTVELEADRYAGFILARMGASHEDAVAAVRAFENKDATLTHPAVEQRVQMISLGWSDGRDKEQAAKPGITLKEITEAWDLAKDTDDASVVEAFREQFGSASPLHDRLAANRLATIKTEALKLAEEKSKAEEAARKAAEMAAANAKLAGEQAAAADAERKAELESARRAAEEAATIAKANREAAEAAAADAKQRAEEVAAASRSTERQATLAKEGQKRGLAPGSNDASPTEPKSGKPALGWSFGHPSRAAAVQRAMGECKAKCKLAVWFQNACGAVAIGQTGGAGWAQHRKRASAEASALGNCRNVDSNCRLEKFVCSGSYGAIAIEQR